MARQRCLWNGGYRERQEELNVMAGMMSGDVCAEPEPISETKLMAIAMGDDPIPCMDDRIPSDSEEEKRSVRRIRRKKTKRAK